MPPSAPHRIRVVGVSGSGKTRLAAEIAGRLGVAHLELDAVFWDAEWTFRDVDLARELILRFLAEHPNGWVADGNWTTRLDGLMQPPTDADLVVWLDHPRWLVMTRILRRTVRRGVTREELWHGNRERPASWLSHDPEKNIILWAWTAYHGTREGYVRLLGQPWFVRLSGRRQVTRWMNSLPQG
jgi:adenylate kinase family enzyme